MAEFLNVKPIVDKGFFTIDFLAKRQLRKVADYVIKESPVYTGAYILSHQITDGNVNAFRSVSGRNRPVVREGTKVSDHGTIGSNKAVEEQARAQLYADIKKLNIRKMKGIYLVNKAVGTSGREHSAQVEQKHRVYSTVRKKFG
jgi:hypothetical protein